MIHCVLYFGFDLVSLLILDILETEYLLSFWSLYKNENFVGYTIFRILPIPKLCRYSYSFLEYNISVKNLEVILIFLLKIICIFSQNKLKIFVLFLKVQ